MDIIKSLSDMISVMPSIVRDSGLFRVEAGADDGQYTVNWGTFNATGTQDRAGKSSSTDNWDTILRFSNCTIPAKAKIVSASIELYQVQAVSGKDINLTIVGNDADNAAAPANASEYSNLVLTTATVVWELEAITATGFLKSPDITSIIQEIVDREGWAGGNAIQILVKNNNSGTNSYLLSYTYNQGASYGAKLNVEYDYVP